MKKQYTRKQIEETIKHWQGILKMMDESKSPLLNAFAEKFGEDVAYSKKPFTLDDVQALLISKIINEFLFESKITSFSDIRVLTYGQYCKTIKFNEMTFCNKQANEIIYPKNTFLGEHYIVIENDFETLKPSDSLQYSHEMILMNADKLKYRSFIFNVAALCHEMIHVYDKWFGDGEDLDKLCILTKMDANSYNEHSHHTHTFIDKQRLAIANNIKVITKMDKKDKVLDKEAIRLMLQALTPEELQIVKESSSKTNNGKKQKISLRHID